MCVRVSRITCSSQAHIVIIKILAFSVGMEINMCETNQKAVRRIETKQLSGNVKYFPISYFFIYMVCDGVVCNCTESFSYFSISSPIRCKKSSNSPPICAYLVTLLAFFSFTASVFFLCPNNCCFATFNKIIVFVFLRSCFCFVCHTYICAHKRASLICLACKFAIFSLTRLVSEQMWSSN